MMQPAVEIVQQIARQRGREGGAALAFLRTLPPRAGSRISHLPVNQELVQAWVTVTGQPFRQHQSLALSTLRRGDPLALVGGAAAARETLHLLLHDLLGGAQGASALIVAPDEATAGLHLADLERLNGVPGRQLKAGLVGSARVAREALTARVLVTTPEALHGRMLRHHDRAWATCWRNLALLAIADAHHYHGVAAAHLVGLLWRSLRLAPKDPPPRMAATLAEVGGADEALAAFTGRPWRVIPVSDTPRSSTALALWRPAGERLREAATLALAFRRGGHRVSIVGAPLDLPLLQPLISADTDRITCGTGIAPASVVIFAGYPGSHLVLHQALESGAELVVLVGGELPVERTLLRLSHDESGPLVDDPPPVWLSAPANAYVSAQHVLCAASEVPLTAVEVEAGQFGQIVERLERHNHLVWLPGAQPTWQPLPGAGDPYAGADLQAAGATGVNLADERGNRLGTFDPALVDRLGFPGAMLPFGRSSYRVIGSDEERLTLTLRQDQNGRRTFPLRRCTVNLRDEQVARQVRGVAAGWGRVLVDEEVYGYREIQGGGAVAERALAPVLDIRWTAPALWIDLPTAAATDGQLLGWSLVFALPLRLICTLGDLVPAYDEERRRLYLVDAQPGGNGFSAWCYGHLEELLPLAYDIALDIRGDALLEPLARNDKDWLLSMLGGDAVRPVPRLAPTPGAEPQPREPNPPPLPVAPVQPEPPPPQRSAPPLKEPPPPEPLPLPLPPPERQAADPTVGNGTSAQPAERTTRRQASGKRNRDEQQRQARDESRRTRSREQTRQPPPEPVPAPKPVPTPKQAPQPAPVPVPEPEPLPDPAAMVARLRRLREQRESATAGPASPPRQASTGLPTPARFAPGDRIFCLPYGYGDVRASQFEDGRELLRVIFPDYGELTIDPSVSMVRRIEPEQGGTDDPPF